MTEEKVKKLYDRLFLREKNKGRGGAYPIHKRLSLEEGDIYQWIIKHISFPPESSVLDAGCGVGFGSILVAQQPRVKLTGISLSEKELEQARLAAKKKALSISFECRSFDSLLPDTYDFVIAVESLKHSTDLKHSLGIVKNALRNKGQLIIVEDFYQKRTLSPDAKKFVRDWELADAFRLEDYYNILEREQCQLSNLTKNMSRAPGWKINLKLASAHMLHSLNQQKGGSVYKIFRGGYYLERLYAAGLMTYQVLVYSKI